MQQVASQAVVEGVPANARSRLQPPRQRERGPLAGASSWQQPLLDLGGQAERPAALTPLEQVRVPTVGDDDEGQRVRHLADLRHDLVIWLLGQMQLQQTDGLAPLGHRGQHPPQPGVNHVRRVTRTQDLHRLGP